MLTRRRTTRTQTGEPLKGEALYAEVRSLSPSVMVAFSCGKDSIAAWLAIREHFEDIRPVFYYLIPDLEFVDEALDYYEQFFQTTIVRVPHPSLYRMMRNAVYQPPERLRILDAADLLEYTYQDIRDSLLEEWGWQGDPMWTCVGIRAADSPYRRMAITKHGSMNFKTQAFYPIWDMNKEGLIELLLKSKVKLPEDYLLFGRSFDGIDYRFLAPLKRSRPKDYQKILDFFPLADIDIARAEFAKRVYV